MKNKKIIATLAMMVSLSCFMTACGFGGDDPEQVVVESTPTPVVTKAPESTPTIAPDASSTTYTSKDKLISIKLPDATWSNKADEEDMISFESPDQGKILVLHGAGEEDMSVAIIPSTIDMAVSLEKASDLEEGTDFEIQDYNATDNNGIGVYTYVVKYLSDKSEDAYMVKKVIASADEYFDIAATVKEDKADVLSKVEESVNSFAIVGDSTLKSAAPAKDEKKSDNKKSDGSSSTEGSTSATGDAATGNGDSTTGDTATGNSSSDTGNASTGSTGSSSSGSGNSSGVIINGGFSDEELTDTNKTRTIYRNSDGKPRVIVPDGAGRWMDNEGTRFDFANDQDVYDENGVDFYYHGEAADVYYMPVE